MVSPSGMMTGEQGLRTLGRVTPGHNHLVRIRHLPYAFLIVDRSRLIVWEFMSLLFPGRLLQVHAGRFSTWCNRRRCPGSFLDLDLPMVHHLRQILCIHAWSNINMRKAQVHGTPSFRSAKTWWLMQWLSWGFPWSEDHDTNPRAWLPGWIRVNNQGNIGSGEFLVSGYEITGHGRWGGNRACPPLPPLRTRAMMTQYLFRWYRMWGSTTWRGWNPLLTV